MPLRNQQANEKFSEGEAKRSFSRAENGIVSVWRPDCINRQSQPIRDVNIHVWDIISVEGVYYSLFLVRFKKSWIGFDDDEMDALGCHSFHRQDVARFTTACPTCIRQLVGD